MSPIVVDLFCGGGGASEGIEMAGLHVDFAVNHDPDAIAMHEANHPRTHHFHRSVWDVSPRSVTRGRPVALLWGSPDCTHFSRAKGDTPLKKEIRDLAWVLADWAEQVRPTMIAMENVPEFVTWGPLHTKETLGLQPFDVPTAADAKRLNRPIPERKGEHFGEFIARLRLQGYRVEWRTLVAADYGAPTTRKRFFLVARCDGEPIAWPEPTHIDRKRPNPDGLPVWRSAAECIDWTIPVRSIFGRRKPLAEATQRRIAEGMRRFVFGVADPFIMPVKSWGGGGNAPRDIAEPMRTVTTSKGGEFAVVAPSLVNLSHGGRTEPVTEPAPTVTTGGGRGGGHLGVMAPVLVQTGYGERDGQAPRCLDISAPLGTVVAAGKHAVATAWIAKHYTGVVGHGPDRPLGTVTAIDHHSLCAADLEQLDGLTAEQREGGRRVAAFILKFYKEGGQWSDPRDPMHTVVTKARMGLVTIELDGETWAIVDIGLRMLEPRELATAQGFRHTYDLLDGATPSRRIRRRLSKAAQIQRIGNSVPPQLVAAVVGANLNGRPHEHLDHPWHGHPRGRSPARPSEARRRAHRRPHAHHPPQGRARRLVVAPGRPSRGTPCRGRGTPCRDRGRGRATRAPEADAGRVAHVADRGPGRR